MKILLRAFAFLTGFLSIVFAGMFVMGISFAMTRWLVRDCVASVVFFFAAFVAVRSTAWLWAECPFWHVKKRKAEVAALGAFIAAWPFVLLAEKHSVDPIRASVQVTAVVVAILAYWSTRRYFRPADDDLLQKTA